VEHLKRVTLDCHRLLCPMPVIRVQDRVAELSPGDELEAVCTDPGALPDIPAWCRINGHEVLETRSQNEEHIVILRVGKGDRL
jgi:tRNA 2-thiouridine synthesizing protein A